jgi:hypothetical protein
MDPIKRIATEDPTGITEVLLALHRADVDITPHLKSVIRALPTHHRPVLIVVLSELEIPIDPFVTDFFDGCGAASMPEIIPALYQAGVDLNEHVELVLTQTLADYV